MNIALDPINLDRIRAVIAEDLQAVDQVIRQRLSSEVALINQIGQYIVGAGGKRVRPALTVIVGNHFKAAKVDIHRLAAVIEFIHTATLLHDDVVDESDLRRGRNTANAEFGNAAAVLVGDFLYSRAFQMMVEAGSMPVMQVMADATNVIAEGEVLQLLNVHDPDTNEEAYLQVVRYKTAKLFEAACRVGAILGGASPAEQQALADYGMHLGTAFQLIDDVLDYSGDLHDTGKNLGDDLAEGKPTLPLIFAQREGDDAQRTAIRAAIEHGGRDNLARVIEALNATGALDYARQAAHLEADRAAAAIDGLADSVYRDALLQLCVFAVERRH
ncbi:MAG: octaprenyl diphosphate synthase [Betaproteobacteria bacterium]|nr:octaprenyl diphosphate synthase [Betaproteobacteria bacterium]